MISTAVVYSIVQNPVQYGTVLCEMLMFSLHYCNIAEKKALVNADALPVDLPCSV